jgi:hypothetical protein
VYSTELVCALVENARRSLQLRQQLDGGSWRGLENDYNRRGPRLGTEAGERIQELDCGSLQQNPRGVRVGYIPDEILETNEDDVGSLRVAREQTCARQQLLVQLVIGCELHLEAQARLGQQEFEGLLQRLGGETSGNSESRPRRGG